MSLRNLQKDPAIDSMRAALTKRVLDSLEKLAKSDAEKYAQFWVEFGQVLKEGVAEDFTTRQNCWVASVRDFDEWIGPKINRLRDMWSECRLTRTRFTMWQRTAIRWRSTPSPGIFNKKGIEVLLLSDRIDEWLVGHLRSLMESRSRM